MSASTLYASASAGRTASRGGNREGAYRPVSLECGFGSHRQSREASMRPSVRFEAFKRDGFTCQYCGRKPPDVVLEADHIIPIADGGDSAIENLATSCQECNRGKGKRPLDSRAPVPDIAAQTEQIREREVQLREYHAALAEAAHRRDIQFDRVWNYWFELWGVETMSHYYTPGKASLQRYIDLLGTDAVMEAMDIARGKFNNLSTYPLRYTFGVLKRKAGRLDGSIQTCPYCHKDVILEDGQDRGEKWVHTACLENRETQRG